MLVHVDNLLIVMKDVAVVEKLKVRLKGVFHIQDQGEAWVSLEVEVERTVF